MLLMLDRSLNGKHLLVHLGRLFDIPFSFVPCHVLLRFRLRARVRSLFFEGFEALIFGI